MEIDSNKWFFPAERRARDRRRNRRRSRSGATVGTEHAGPAIPPHDSTATPSTTANPSGPRRRNDRVEQSCQARGT